MIPNVAPGPIDGTLPPGVTPAGWKFDLLGPQPQSIMVGDPLPAVVAFPETTTPGTYTSQYKRLDTNGNTIGNVVPSSNSITISGPTTIKVAGTLAFV